MSDEPVETFVHNGHTVALHYDTECDSPRDVDSLVGLFLGLPHRSYDIGDERINPEEEFPCPDCAGRGCATCYDSGARAARSLTELAAALKAKHSARVLLPVGMIDHSGVSYYVGGGPHWSDTAGWDSGTCGFILDTPDRLQQTMGAGTTDEQITKALTGEIEEYDRWARGDCYGYVITDPNGEQVESCWGFIGHDYAVEEAKEIAGSLQAPAGIRFAIVATVEVDRAAWAHEYGVDTAEVPVDVAAYYTADQIGQALRTGGNPLGPLGVLGAVTVRMPPVVGQERSGE